MTWAVFIENGTYSCTCKAANKPACVHRAAVYLAKVQAHGAKVVGVKPAARRQVEKPVGAPAPLTAPAGVDDADMIDRPRATATFRIGGVEFTGHGRNVLDALGNAQAAA